MLLVALSWSICIIFTASRTIRCQDSSIWKKRKKVLVQGSRSAQILDLDRLIELLEAVESQRMNYSYEEVSDEDLSEDSSDVAEIISETLAKIHEAQGNKKEAIQMYERLVTVNEDKADTYTNKIEELKSD